MHPVAEIIQAFLFPRGVYSLMSDYHYVDTIISLTITNLPRPLLPQTRLQQYSHIDHKLDQN